MSSILVLLVLLASTVEACLLCPQRIPLRPKPLDQFRLPSIKKILDTTSAIRQLCNNETKSVSEQCGKDVSHLFCSLNKLVQYSSIECPGQDDAEACTTCQLEAAQMYNANSWVMTWIDSIGKMPAGISDGNYHWLGDYEQCENLQQSGVFNGHYCLVNFEVPDTVLNTKCDEDRPLEVHLGICLPASCSVDETKQLIEEVLQHQMHVQCEPPVQWSIGSQIFMHASLFWIVVVLLITVLMWCLKPSDSIYYEIAKSLSLQSNLQVCFRTTCASYDFNVVPGLQVVSLFMLINGHVFYLIMPYLENVSFSYKSSENVLLQPIVNFSLYVDGLLALVALRISLHVARGSFSTSRKIIGHFIRRAVKIWPAYVYVTIFSALLYVRLGSGPMWSHNDLPNRCLSSWWANILLVNNLLGIKETCLDGGFLVALELQFYIFALALIFLLQYSKPGFNVVITALCVISSIFTFFVAYTYKTYATLIPTAEAFKADNGDIMYENYINKIYLNPLARVAPFLVGLAAPQWFSHRIRRLRSVLTPTCVVVCSAIFFFIVWGPLFIGDATGLYAGYASVHRTLWAVGVIFIAFIFNSIEDSNVFKAILSWKAFYPMSKMVLLVFLISEPVALSLFSSLHRPLNATLFNIILTSIGTFVCSYIAAVVVIVFLVLPIRHLVDLFFFKQKPESEQSTSADNSECAPLNNGQSA